MDYTARAIDTGELADGQRLRRRRLRHASTSAAASRGRRCRAMRSSSASTRPARRCSRWPIASRPRRSARSRLGLGLPGPARPLPRPPRGHRAVDGRAPSPGRRDDRQRPLMPTAPTTPSPNLTIEAIVAVDAPREFRLHPRDRVVAYTAEAAGARQLFTMSLRGGYPIQLTASEKPVSDPQWSPDGRRLAFVRDDEIWVVEADGSRLTRRGRQARRRSLARAGRPTASGSPSCRAGAAGPRSGSIDAPVPRRGRPATRAEAAASDRPDRRRDRRRRVRLGARRGAPRGHGSAPRGRRRDRPDRASSTSRPGRCGSSPASAAATSGPRWAGDGSLLYVSDADGWFQVVRLTADGHDRIVLTAGEREHGEPGGGVGSRAAAVARRQPVRPRRGPRRPAGPRRRPDRRRRAAEARPGSPAEDAADRQRGAGRQPDQPVGRASGGPSAGPRTGPGSPRSASASPARRTCGCCPFPASRRTVRGRAR